MTCVGASDGGGGAGDQPGNCSKGGSGGSGGGGGAESYSAAPSVEPSGGAGAAGPPLPPVAAGVAPSAAVSTPQNLQKRMPSLMSLPHAGHCIFFPSHAGQQPAGENARIHSRSTGAPGKGREKEQGGRRSHGRRPRRGIEDVGSAAPGLRPEHWRPQPARPGFRAGCSGPRRSGRPSRPHSCIGLLFRSSTDKIGSTEEKRWNTADTTPVRNPQASLP
jgi:hypothetical protein